MKPTFRVHFSRDHPNRPGLWLTRRDNFITTLQVQAGDLEQDKRHPAWLDGEWGAQIELVDRDLVPLDKRKVQEYLDKKITENHEARHTSRVDVLQEVRLALLGSLLDLPQINSPEPQPEPPTL